jgi:hypothetical protein
MEVALPVFYILVPIYQGYGEMVANDNVKFPIRGFDRKLLFYYRFFMEVVVKVCPLGVVCIFSLVFSRFLTSPERYNQET